MILPRQPKKGKTFRFAQDVIEVLDRQPNQTKFLEDLVRGYGAKTSRSQKLLDSTKPFYCGLKQTRYYFEHLPLPECETCKNVCAFKGETRIDRPI